MVDLADAMVAYRTHPHEDVVETGTRAAHILLDVLTGKTKPVMRCKKTPMMFFDGGTEKGRLRDIFDLFIKWDEMDGVVACSLCPSFTWQDVPEQGWAALAVTNHDAALAERLAAQLADACWEARHELLPKPMVSPDEAVRQAAAVAGCPVVIADPADNVGGGGGGDNTVLLDALLRLRGEVEGLILHHIPDPEATALVRRAKVGETVTVKVGGKRDSRFSSPVSVTGQVLCVTEGPIADDGEFTAKAQADTGAIVLLGIDNVRLVLTERLVHGPQPSLFRKVGIEPFEAKIVAVKSGIGYRVTYGHVAKDVIIADCPGALSGNLSNYDFQRIPRPMFPIDGDFDWKAGA
jgi:microcystin degradation protein MlrC